MKKSEGLSYYSIIKIGECVCVCLSLCVVQPTIRLILPNCSYQLYKRRLQANKILSSLSYFPHSEQKPHIGTQLYRYSLVLLKKHITFIMQNSPLQSPINSAIHVFSCVWLSRERSGWPLLQFTPLMYSLVYSL